MDENRIREVILGLRQLPPAPRTLYPKDREVEVIYYYCRYKNTYQSDRQLTGQIASKLDMGSWQSVRNVLVDIRKRLDVTKEEMDNSREVYTIFNNIFPIVEDRPQFYPWPPEGYEAPEEDTNKEGDEREAIAELKGELEKKEQELNIWQQDISKRDAETVALIQSATQTLNELKRERKRLHKLEQELTEQESKKKTDLQQQQAELSAKEKELSGWARSLEKDEEIQKVQLIKEKEQLQKERAALDEARSQIEQREQELEERERRFENPETEELEDEPQPVDDPINEIFRPRDVQLPPPIAEEGYQPLEPVDEQITETSEPTIPRPFIWAVLIVIIVFLGIWWIRRDTQQVDEPEEPVVSVEVSNTPPWPTDTPGPTPTRVPMPILETFSGDEFTPELTIEGDSYTWIDDYLSVNGPITFTAGNEAWRDYAVILKAEARGARFEDPLEIQIRKQDDYNYIALQIAGCNTRWVKYIEGEMSVIHDSERGVSGVCTDWWRAEVNGNVYGARNNQNPIIQFRDNTYKSGYVTIKTGNFETIIDRINIGRPPKE